VEPADPRRDAVRVVIWRKQLDQTGIDPREEISFQNQLTHYSRLLEQQGGSVTQDWKPGIQPDEWSD
jgi:hypothetical protein